MGYMSIKTQISARHQGWTNPQKHLIQCVFTRLVQTTCMYMHMRGANDVNNKDVRIHPKTCGKRSSVRVDVK